MTARSVFLSATFAAVGFLTLPVVHRTQPVLANQVTPLTSVALSPAVSEANTKATPVNIEQQIEPQADGRIDSEITFSGNANDVVVVRVERVDGLSPTVQKVNLYSSDGEEITARRNYPHSMSFNEQLTNDRTFLLPETGEYRVVFGGEANTAHSNGLPTGDTEYLVQVRTATEYENLVMLSNDFTENTRYEEALESLARAIDISPAIPAAYFARIYAYVNMLYIQPEFEARLDQLYVDADAETTVIAEAFFATFHETFRTLPTEEQTTVINDFRQLAALQDNAQDNAAATLREGSEDENEEIPFDLVADFLETGTPADSLMRMYFYIE